MEKYTVTIVIQSATGTYTRTLEFENQSQADKVQAAFVALIEKQAKS